MSVSLRVFLSLVALLFAPGVWAQFYGEESNSMFMGAMIMGGFVMMAAIGALIALAIFLLRKSRSYPRHAHRI